MPQLSFHPPLGFVIVIQRLSIGKNTQRVVYSLYKYSSQVIQRSWICHDIQHGAGDHWHDPFAANLPHLMLEDSRERHVVCGVDAGHIQKLVNQRV